MAVVPGESAEVSKKPGHMTGSVVAAADNSAEVAVEVVIVVVVEKADHLVCKMNVD